MVNIFQALGVETEEDIHKLSTYFMHTQQNAADQEQVGFSCKRKKDGQLNCKTDTQ